jgi:hypothetical protein
LKLSGLSLAVELGYVERAIGSLIAIIDDGYDPPAIAAIN